MRTIQSIIVAVAMLAATMLLAANANGQCAVTPGIAPLSKAATFLEKSAAALSLPPSRSRNFLDS